MLALVAAPQTSEKIELREVNEPVPAPNEAVLEVKAISLNRGECNGVLNAQDGWRPGWDIAGVIKKAAADGSGPSVGSRVVGFVPSGGWAQQVAVITAQIAQLPDDVSFAQASTLPVAGLTALRTLRLGGLLLNKRVLITGASGGVGRFAVQLAAKAGAHVTAIAASADRGEGLAGLGAHEVFSDMEEAKGQFDLILESAGGASMATAFRIVGSNGTIVSFGNSSKQETSFNVGTFFGKQPQLIGFSLLAPSTEPFSSDLRYLAGLISQKQLDPQISYEGKWQQAGEAIAALIGRKVVGKAVLEVN